MTGSFAAGVVSRWVDFWNRAFCPLTYRDLGDYQLTKMTTLEYLKYALNIA